MRVGLVQINSQEDRHRNVARAIELIDHAVAQGAQLVALPECVTFLGRKEHHAANAETLETPLLEAAAEMSTKLTIDLAGAEYISSAGLRLFMMAAKRLRTRGERLSLRGVQPNALVVLQMANFTSFLDVVA